MNKNIIFSLIFIISISLMSCSKWGGNNPVGVTGGVVSWQNENENYNSGNYSSLIGSWRYDDYYSNYYEIITFNSNGKFSIYLNDSGNEDTLYGTYSVTGNQLTFTFDRGSSISFIFSVSNDTLTLTNAEEGITLTYYKI